MLNILTITLNPSIDKTLDVDGLYADRKLHCTVRHFDPGGGGINVSRAIKNLGGTSQCWFLEGGYHGDFLIQLVREKKLHYRGFPIINETRENCIVYDQSTGAQYLLDTEGPVVYDDEWKAILAAVTHATDIDLIVASGSLPQGIPKDFYGKLAIIAKSKGMKLILDANGEALELAIKEGIYLFKPNLREFCALTGADPENAQDLQSKAGALIKAKFCEAIIVSLGAQGALFVGKGYSEHIAAPIVKTKSTVGAGDSMLAGIVYQLSIGNSFRNSVVYGVASGAAATLNAGTALCTKSDTEAIFAGLKQTNPLK